MNKKNQLSPIDIMIYYRIKSFTENGNLKCCCELNKTIGIAVDRHPVSVSKSIGKLSRLGYITIVDDDKEFKRKLEITKKVMTVSYFPIKEGVKEIAKAINENAKVVNYLAKAINENAKDTLAKSLRGVREIAKHNIYINTYFIINSLNREIKESFDFIEDEKWKDLFLSWITYKIKINSQLKEISYKSAYDKLVKLSGDDFEKASDIVGESIANSWKGLFNWKGKGGGQNNPTLSKNTNIIEKNNEAMDFDRKVAIKRGLI